jgi:hypothetical protein
VLAVVVQEGPMGMETLMLILPGGRSEVVPVKPILLVVQVVELVRWVPVDSVAVGVVPPKYGFNMVQLLLSYYV